MNPEEIKAALTEEEWGNYQEMSEILSKAQSQLLELKAQQNYALDIALIEKGRTKIKKRLYILESLAASRQLSEERRKMLEEIYRLSHYTYAGQKEFKPSIPLSPDLKNRLAALLKRDSPNE